MSPEGLLWAATCHLLHDVLHPRAAGQGPAGPTTYDDRHYSVPQRNRLLHSPQDTQMRSDMTSSL